MLAALEAGWVTVLMSNPLWVINTRQMTVRQGDTERGWIGALLPHDSLVIINGRGLSLAGTLREIVKKEGLKGLSLTLTLTLTLIRGCHRIFKAARSTIRSCRA